MDIIIHYYTYYTLDFYLLKILQNFKGVFYDFLMCFDVQLVLSPTAVLMLFYYLQRTIHMDIGVYKEVFFHAFNGVSVV